MLRKRLAICLKSLKKYSGDGIQYSEDPVTDRRLVMNIE